MRFKDGDRWNWAIENLELATGRDMGARRIAQARKANYKTCTVCGWTKPLSAFRPKKRTSGMSCTPECRDCLKKYERAYQNRPEVRLVHNERRRRHRAERRGG